MKIIIGTQNKRKLAAVEAVVDSLVGNEGISVSGCSAGSDVRDTPLDEETKKGAVNRARNSMQCEPGADMYIGIESGLVHRYGEWFEEVWVAAVYEGAIVTAYSSGIALPKMVSEQLTTDVQNHMDIMNALRLEHDIDVHAELGVDTWGNYTGNKVVREVGLEEAVRNTLVQIFPGEKSFYNK
jgi:non-canonical (house-cleaning) NTP pyrophosphatase